MFVNKELDVIEVLNQIKKGYITGQKTVYGYKYSISLLRVLDFLCREGFIETFWRDVNGLLTVQLKYDGAGKVVKFQFKSYSTTVRWNAGIRDHTHVDINQNGNIFIKLDTNALINMGSDLFEAHKTNKNKCRIENHLPDTFLRGHQGVKNNKTKLIAQNRQQSFEKCIQPKGVFCIQTVAGLVNEQQALAKGETGPILFYFER